jgi:pimeloyl-ACP methyl ester carboxylesterase
MTPSLLLALALSAPSLEARPFPIKAYHGKERTIQRFSLRVPADHRQPGGRTLQIAGYLFPAKGARSAPPIVFLMGGPGIPATVLAPIPPYFDLFDRLSEATSVVLLDQRGLGESVPKVDCPALATPPPTDTFSRKQKLLAAFQALGSACAEHWRKASFEPDDFTIEAIADDVDALRAALGAEQVDLLAFSYGTRIASEVLRRHPTIVRRAVLQGVLVSTIRMPDVDERTFRAIAALADEQAAAKGFDRNLEHTLREIQRRLARAPVDVTVRSLDGRPVRLPVGRDVFDALVASRLGDRRLPAVLTTVHRGDATILAHWVETLYQDLEKGGPPLVRGALVCSSAEDRRTAENARRRGRRSLLGEPFDNLQQGEEYCRALGLRRPAKRASVHSAARALLISGSLDDRTPPQRAERAREGLASSAHVVVRNGGHELLTEPKVQDAVVAFLRDGTVGSTVIDLEKPDFPDVAAARNPPRRGR